YYFLHTFKILFYSLSPLYFMFFLFFFFTDPAPTEISTLSLHDALPILRREPNHPQVLFELAVQVDRAPVRRQHAHGEVRRQPERSEEHTSELQSRGHLVCRLLLEKKKNTTLIRI